MWKAFLENRSYQTRELQLKNALAADNAMLIGQMCGRAWRIVQAMREASTLQPPLTQNLIQPGRHFVSNESGRTYETGPSPIQVRQVQRFRRPISLKQFFAQCRSIVQTPHPVKHMFLVVVRDRHDNKFAGDQPLQLLYFHSFGSW